MYNFMYTFFLVKEDRNQGVHNTIEHCILMQIGPQAVEILFLFFKDFKFLHFIPGCLPGSEGMSQARCAMKVCTSALALMECWLVR